MNRTMTVKELIKALLEHDMGEPVYIGLGPDLKPSGSAQVLNVKEHGVASGITCGYGVYLTPLENLQDADGSGA